VGTGLLAVPILAGSAAYAVAETFTWREGLYRRLRQAPGFYGVIAFATGLGAAINVVGINPIKALYYTAVLNGLVTPPLLWMILLMSNNRTIMQENVNGCVPNILGWVTTLAMTMAAGALLVTFSAGR
jgi:Mn2+/Fe2+ NRAMP family transporter